MIASNKKEIWWPIHLFSMQPNWPRCLEYSTVCKDLSGVWITDAKRVSYFAFPNNFAIEKYYNCTSGLTIIAKFSYQQEAQQCKQQLRWMTHLGTTNWYHVKHKQYHNIFRREVECHRKSELLLWTFCAELHEVWKDIDCGPDGIEKWILYIIVYCYIVFIFTKLGFTEIPLLIVAREQQTDWQIFSWRHTAYFKSLKLYPWYFIFIWIIVSVIDELQKRKKKAQNIFSKK